MACVKGVLTNTTNKIIVINYQECENLVWEYGVEIQPSESINVWSIDGTIYGANLNQLTQSFSVFPPVAVSPTPTPSQTASPTPTPTVTNTPGLSPTPTETIPVTPTSTETPTPTTTLTLTPTETSTPTPTETSTPTPTPSSTPLIQGLFFTMQEVGLNVILSGTGTANVTSLNLSGTSTTFQPFIDPSSGMFSVGVGGDYDVYSGTTFNSAPFGTGGYIIPNIAGGNEFGISVNSLVVPIGYTGGILNGYSQFDNTDLATLSATTGTYLVQWGSSGASETITFDIL